MNKPKEILYKSFDDELSSEEQSVLDKSLIEDPKFRQEKEEIIQLRSALSVNQKSFDPGFADRVTTRLNKEKSTLISHDFLRVFKSVAITGVAAIIALLITIYITDGTLNIDTIFGLSEYAPDEAYLSFLNIQDIN